MAPRRRIVSLSLVLVLALANWTGPATGQSPSAPVETTSPEVISLVGLGDSFAAGWIGCSGECRSFVHVYGNLVEEALGRPVEVTNLATSDGLASGGLLQRVTGGGAHRMALAGADVITVMIGWNDWQGPCFWERLGRLLRSDATHGPDEPHGHPRRDSRSCVRASPLSCGS